MVTLDAFASLPHYAAHLAPVFAALPEEHRGTFWTAHRALTKWAQHRGIPAVLGNARKDGPTVIVAGYHDVTECHPARPVIYLEHGSGQTYASEPFNSSYPGGTQRGRVGLFLVPGPRSAALEQARYPDARVEIVGCPRLDGIARFPATRHPDAPLVVGFAWHWDFRMVPETRWAWPAWKDQVRALHNTGEFQVLGSGHPRQFSQLASWYETCGIEPVSDADEVLTRADVLCFDNSSIGFEAMACGLGVVALNAPYYRRDVEHGLRFWEHAPPVSLWPGDDLAAGIRQSVTPETLAATRAISDWVYPPETRGRAAQLAADAALEYALEQGERPCQTAHPSPHRTHPRERGHRTRR